VMGRTESNRATVEMFMVEDEAPLGANSGQEAFTGRD